MGGLRCRRSWPVSIIYVNFLMKSQGFKCAGGRRDYAVVCLRNDRVWEKFSSASGGVKERGLGDAFTCLLQVLTPNDGD